MHTARPVPSPRRHLRLAIPASPYPIPQMLRPVSPMPLAAFAATLRPFACPVEKEWSRHDRNHAPNIPRRTAITPEAIT